jgi:hypothetical protein
MDLIVDTHLLIWQIFVAIELDPVHSKVGLPPSSFLGIFGIDQRQCDKRPAIIGPTFDLWKMFKGARIGKDRGEPCPSG